MAHPWLGSTGAPWSLRGKTMAGQLLPPGRVISPQLGIQVIKEMD